MTYTPERIALLMAGWKPDNLRGLYNKMKRKGVMKGGILSSRDENLALFKYLQTKCD